MIEVTNFPEILVRRNKISVRSYCMEKTLLVGVALYDVQSTFVVVWEEYGSEAELVLHTAVCSGSLGLACDSERVDVWIAVCLAWLSLRQLF